MVYVKSKGRVVTNVTETVKKNEDIVASFLPAYAMTGCHSVSHYHGIRKVAVVKALKKKTFRSFVHFGHIESKIR